jgi:AcrR family transcriptional regulator
MTKEELEGYLIDGLSLAQIAKRVGRNPSTISYHLRKHGLKPVGAKYVAKGALSRDVLEQMVDDGVSLREMARRLDRNMSSVRHWLIKYEYWPLASGKRRAAAKRARDQGLKRVEMECRHHGRTEFILEGRGAYRCLSVAEGPWCAGVGMRSSVSLKRPGVAACSADTTSLLEHCTSTMSIHRQSRSDWRCEA